MMFEEFEKIAEILHQLTATSRTTLKQNILKRNADVPGFKEALQFIYNPYTRTGVTRRGLGKYISHLESFVPSSTSSYINYKDVINHFNLYQTGRDSDIIFAATFVACVDKKLNNPIATEIAIAFVTKSLMSGISVTTLNKVYGNGFIRKIGCMLGTLLTAVPQDKVKYPCIVTEKLDGIRRILIKENGKISMYSRSGHADNGCVDILTEAQYLPDNAVYDGELLAIGTFNTSIEQRQASSSIANKKGEKHHLTFNIFDAVSIHEYNSGEFTTGAIKRKTILNATLGDDSIKLLLPDYKGVLEALKIPHNLQFIKPVPILGMVNNLEEVRPIVNEIWSRGGEGVMLNADTPYELKRTKNLLKVKNVEEVTLKVIDVQEGDKSLAGSLGAIIVDYKGYRVGVGSGFTHELRRKIWNNPGDYIGREVEIDTFGESTNKDGGISLNCPVFKRWSDELE